MTPPIRIGISACLLGQEVRFDGGHKRDAFVMEMFGSRVEWVPVCPEVEVGMSTPREALRLERDGRAVRMMTIHTRIDYTDLMNAWSTQRIAVLTHADLDGYVLKSDSPSCGMEGVKVFDAAAGPVRDGRGLFAAALLAAIPLLPLEDDARLSDSRMREDFLERVFAYRRSKDVLAGR